MLNQQHHEPLDICAARKTFLLFRVPYGHFQAVSFNAMYFSKIDYINRLTLNHLASERLLIRILRRIGVFSQRFSGSMPCF